MNSIKKRGGRFVVSNPSATRPFWPTRPPATPKDGVPRIRLGKREPTPPGTTRARWGTSNAAILPLLSMLSLASAKQRTQDCALFFEGFAPRAAVGKRITGGAAVSPCLGVGNFGRAGRGWRGDPVGVHSELAASSGIYVFRWSQRRSRLSRSRAPGYRRLWGSGSPSRWRVVLEIGGIGEAWSGRPRPVNGKGMSNSNCRWVPSRWVEGSQRGPAAHFRGLRPRDIRQRQH
jgi:hypothetical protein